MSELEEKIQSVLNDPEQFRQIAAMAQELMGGMTESHAAPESTDTLPDLGTLRRFLREEPEKNSRRALLEAMKPCLSEKRQKKLEKAMRMARLAALARRAMGDAGEEGAG